MLLKTRIGEGLHKESVTDFPRRQTRQNVNIVNLRATLNIVKLMIRSGLDTQTHEPTMKENLSDFFSRF